MKKTSGQALVEFIMILPIFLLIVFSTIDFSKIIYEKYNLQNDLDIIKQYYSQKDQTELNNYLQQNHLKIDYTHKDTYIIITISKNIDIITPGLNRILKSPYKVYESVTLLYEP